jgi:hypothetical protein
MQLLNIFIILVLSTAELNKGKTTDIQEMSHFTVFPVFKEDCLALTDDTTALQNNSLSQGKETHKSLQVRPV